MIQDPPGEHRCFPKRSLSWRQPRSQGLFPGLGKDPGNEVELALGLSE